MPRPRTSIKHYALFALYLLKEFRLALTLFAILVFAGGLLFHLTLAEGHVPYLSSCYDIFLMTFMQSPMHELPDDVGLQLFAFLVPIVGLLIVTEGLVRFGMLVFSRKRHLPEWWLMVAQSMSDHVVLCGMGRVGFRIADELLALGQPFVAIERNGENPLVKEMQERGVPVLLGDVRFKSTLEKANVSRAKALIAATNDDLANLDAALTAREINPSVHVVLRLFDDTLANKVARSFGLPAISTSHNAASAFIAAALKRQVYQQIDVGGTAVHLADLSVADGSPLVGRTVDDVSRASDVAVVVLRRGGKTDYRPEPATKLEAGDVLVVAGERGSVRALTA